MADMISTFERYLWAMAARGYTPAAKLVLIIAADKADCDCRYADMETLADVANLTDAGLKKALDELAAAGAIAVHQTTEGKVVELLIRRTA